MKRIQTKRSRESGQSATSRGSIRVVEPRRLAAVRGGTDLGILVAGGGLPADYISPQHNEALVQR